MRPFRTLRLPSRPTLPSQRHVCPPSSQLKTTRTINTTRPSLRQPLPINNTKTTTRSFGLPNLSSFLPNNSSPHRVLTATRNLPYNPALLYKVISSVESYSQFLPFLTASTVTARDPETGYPTQAFLTVGYGPLSETFTSRVICDVEKLTVEANSGAKYGEKDGQGKSSGLSGLFPGANEGLFEYLTTRWELVPLSGTQGPLTKVNLEVRFEFRSQMHATIMSSVEGQMAGVMIEAFEKRMREVEGKGQ
ncbi:Cyclase/dehydrase [Penicillium griseofulvum]|uniref:Cyclase/dehydrase n=1 Tax=Penicillium patulum TaxID=5078 RepID=A0A135L959_PENPA|nr:Cyclase/dehydrase [Penicillium griseofulvum]KXG45483.1 Cyclase/dehydrase [Penicillium griseofulvum]